MNNSSHNLDLVQAYLIHAKSYRDTSLLIDFFTQEHGFITAIAKGVRGDAKTNKRGLLQPFTKLLINWRGKSDLVTLNTIELAAQPLVLKKNHLAVGFYINELLYYLCNKPRGIIFTNLFENYETVLAHLNQPNQELALIEPKLREFELDLLSSIGYGLSDHNILPECHYAYDFTEGFIISPNTLGNKLSLRGDLILNIMQRNWQDKQTLVAAKQLLRSIIKYYIGNKDLHSRKLFV